ncbi:MAG: hypothetical protein ACRD6N_11245 [Pyrinomonadaceae bacterium]
MKSVVNQIIVALLLVTMTSVTSFAKSKKTTVTFAVDTKVNETLVKSGTYELVFNEESGELSIVKGRKVVAKTAARLEMRDSKGRSTEVYTVKDGDEIALVGLAFGGSDQKVVLNQARIQAGGNEQNQ